MILDQGSGLSVSEVVYCEVVTQGEVDDPLVSRNGVEMT